MYKRSNRNKQNDTNNNSLFIFYRDLLDQIHSFILHSFDSGMRIKCGKNDDNDDEKKIIFDDNINIIDKDLKIINENILKSQKDLEKIEMENERLNLHKYDLNTNIYKKDAHFNIGYTFYYWDYYKNNNNIKQLWFNKNYLSGYKASELYIEPKYDSLKEELLNNIIQNIKPITYKQIYEKAKIYFMTENVKRIKAGDEDEFLHYGINDGSSLNIEHLICIILYTDLSELSRSYSSTFRLLHPSEMLSSIKDRNREYWNWSKLMRESIEYFGDLMGHQRQKIPFYCGTSYMLTATFLIRICGPTSTTKQLSVAFRFAENDGIILQLNNGSNYFAQNLRYFNCVWLSAFPDEDERLFCGGSWPLRVESVRLIKNKQNLKLFFKALFYFDCMLKGISVTSNAKQQITKMDKLIIKKLIEKKINNDDNNKENNFGEYINNSFSLFCKYKKQIIVNQRQIDENTPSLKDILFIRKDSNIINMELISVLFTKCKSIIIYDDENEKQLDLQEFIIICKKYIDSNDCNIETISIGVYRGDNDQDTWLKLAVMSLNQDISSRITITKTRELNDEYWDIMTIH